jgi:IclR family acetate operon transcriptional repressor
MAIRRVTALDEDPAGAGASGAIHDADGHERLATSLLKALSIMEALGPDPEVSLSEVSRRTGIGKGTVHRVLTTLASQGYVERIEHNRTYCLGIRTFQLGAKAIANRDVRTAALDEMRQLSQATGEVVNLAIPAVNGVVVLERQEGEQMVQMRSRVGSLLPLENTSLGLAHLSTLPADEVDTRFPRVRRELMLARERGFAIDDCRFQPDLRCVSAPIYAASGRVVGMIGISSPAYRASMQRLEQELGPSVRASAQAISGKLGGQSVRRA